MKREFRPAGAGTRVFEDDATFSSKKTTQKLRECASMNDRFSTNDFIHRTQMFEEKESLESPDSQPFTSPIVSKAKSFRYEDINMIISKELDPLVKAREDIGRFKGLLSKVNSQQSSPIHATNGSSLDLIERIRRLREFNPLEDNVDDLLSPKPKPTETQADELYSSKPNNSLALIPKNETDIHSVYTEDTGYDSDDFGELALVDDTYFSIDLPPPNELLNLPLKSNLSSKGFELVTSVDYIDDFNSDHNTKFPLLKSLKFTLSPIFDKIRSTFTKPKQEKVYFYKGSYISDDFIKSSGEVGRKIRAKHLGIPYKPSGSGFALFKFWKKKEERSYRRKESYD